MSEMEDLRDECNCCRSNSPCDCNPLACCGGCSEHGHEEPEEGYEGCLNV